MPVSIHIPRELMARVDQRAAELKMSRSRYIARILEQALSRETDWSEDFLRAVDEARQDREARRALDEMDEAIVRSRSSKAPPRLTKA